MKAAFDHMAVDYDAEFTNTPIGRLQREMVWSYLNKVYKDNFPQKVLELNCGTGEDAVFFAKNGSEVLATDISEKMLNATDEKINLHHLRHKITAKQLDINNFASETFDHRFDLVFSNFGGLNCIDVNAFSSLFTKMATHLNPHGRMILVLMPRFCAWESVYFLSRLNTTDAFRRRKDRVQSADLGKSSINVWYYDPAQISIIASLHFKTVHIQPVGIAVPPSYFKRTFISNSRILKNLNAAEKKLNKFKQLARMADHYLIDLELK